MIHLRALGLLAAGVACLPLAAALLLLTALWVACRAAGQLLMVPLEALGRAHARWAADVAARDAARASGGRS